MWNAYFEITENHLYPTGVNFFYKNAAWKYTLHTFHALMCSKFNLTMSIFSTSRSRPTLSSRFSQNPSVYFRLLRPGEAIKLQLSLQWLTYSQSVSPVSAPILSQPIHSAYLCLPRGDGTPSAWNTHTHTRSHARRHTLCRLLDSAYLSVWRGQRKHNTNAAVSLSTSCNIQNQCVAAINTSNLHPRAWLWVMCVCVCVYRGGFNPSQTTQWHFVAQEVISRKKEKETDLKER